jgi:putative transposase
MARPLRLEFEDALWHVFARGNNYENIFRDDADRLRFLEMLAETVMRFGWKLIAWVLMSNHYHLEFETPQPNLSRGMHWLNGRYAQYFNRRHKRVGHLFQGRFKGLLVERESYLLTCARYIVLNPVDAHIVDRPEQYRWSSYHQTAGLEPAAPWLALDALLPWFGRERPDAQREYRNFIAAGIDKPLPLLDFVAGQIYLGSDPWRERIQSLIDAEPRSIEHPRAQLSIARPTMEDVLEAVQKTFDLSTEAMPSRSATTARQVAAYLAFEDGLIVQSAIARALGLRSRGGVSSLVSRCRAAISANAEFRDLVTACRSRMHRRAPPPSPPPGEFSYPFLRRPRGAMPRS